MKIPPYFAATSAFFVLPSIASAGTILAGFHNFDSNNNSESADVAALGISGNVTDSLASEVQGGSNDNFYGNSALPVLPGSPTGAATQDGHAKVQTGLNLTFSVTNISAGSQPLEAFLFDAAYKIDDGSMLLLEWSLDGSPLGSQQIFPDHQQGADFAGAGNFSDYSIDLTGVTLATSQTLDFLFSTTATASGETFRLDNVALTAIPETNSLMALSGLILLGSFFRSRR